VRKNGIEVLRPKTGELSIPRFFSDAEIDQLRRLSPLVNEETIADFFGISTKTLWRIKKEQPEVDIVMRAGKAKLADKITKAFYDKCLEGNVPSMIFYLKCKQGWRETSSLEISTQEKPAMRTIVDVFEALPEIEDNSDEEKGQ